MIFIWKVEGRVRYFLSKESCHCLSDDFDGQANTLELMIFLRIVCPRKVILTDQSFFSVSLSGRRKFTEQF